MINLFQKLKNLLIGREFVIPFVDIVCYTNPEFIKMSNTFRKKPFSYYRQLNIQPEYKDPELLEIGYTPRLRHQRRLSSWDDIPFSSYIKYNFK